MPRPNVNKTYSAMAILPVAVRFRSLPGKTPEEIMETITSPGFMEVLSKHLHHAGREGSLVDFSIPVLEQPIEAILVDQRIDGLYAPNTGVWFETNAELKMTRNRRRLSRPNAPGCHAARQQVSPEFEEETELRDFLASKDPSGLAMLLLELTQKAGWTVEQELAFGEELTGLSQLALSAKNRLSGT